MVAGNGEGRRACSQPYVGLILPLPSTNLVLERRLVMGVRIMRVWLLTVPFAAVLTGCSPLGLVIGATASANQPSNYVRADGGPFDTRQRQATLEQCKGQAAIEAKGILSETKQIDITKACMARNGYTLVQ
jgi:hypothetical protein